MKRKIYITLSLLLLFCSNIFCNEMNQKFEKILSNHQNNAKVIHSKKINLKNCDKDYYFINWCFVSDPKVTFSYIYEYTNQNLIENKLIWIQKNYLTDIKSNYILDDLDYFLPNFLQKSNFFSNYCKSSFYLQCENKRITDTFNYVMDIDNDGNDEILTFESIAGSDFCTFFDIYKYTDQGWTQVFREPYFGWEEFLYQYKEKEWYLPKKFPYDFIEYKGKIGLRIVCYNNPKYIPTQYRAQFWAYDENTKKYEMLEEIWEEEEFTPPDGLIFAEAKEALFYNE